VEDRGKEKGRSLVRGGPQKKGESWGGKEGSSYSGEKGQVEANRPGRRGPGGVSKKREKGLEIKDHAPLGVESCLPPGFRGVKIRVAWLFIHIGTEELRDIRSCENVWCDTGLRKFAVGPARTLHPEAKRNGDTPRGRSGVLEKTSGL